MKTEKFLLCAILLSCRLCAFSQVDPPIRLTVEQTLIRAESQNPQLASAKRNVQAAQAGLTVAAASPNPRVSVDIPFGGLGETVHDVLLEQPLELGGKRGARMAVARDQIAQAEIQLDQLRWQVRAGARQAYMELTAANGTEQNAESMMKINRELVDIAEKRFAAGDAAEIDVIRARFAAEQSRQILENTHNRVVQANINLNLLLNLPADTVVVPSESPSITKEQSPDLGMLKRTAMQNRYDLILSKNQVQSASDQVRLSEAIQTPDLTLATGYLWDPTIDAGSYLAGIRVDLPIFNTHSGEVDQARAEEAAAKSQERALILQIDSEVFKAYQNYISARLLLERDQSELLPQGDQVLDLSEKSYRLGESGLSDVLLAEQSVADMRNAYVNDLLKYETAIGDLERAVNQPLFEGNANR